MVCAGPSSMPALVMQAKKNTMMAILYAVPSALINVEWLTRRPPLLKGFFEALKASPDCPERLTGLALFARLCVSEVSRNQLAPFLPSIMPWPYCVQAQHDGLFGLLYTTLEHVLTVCYDSLHNSACRCCIGPCCTLTFGVKQDFVMPYLLHCLSQLTVHLLLLQNPCMHLFAKRFPSCRCASAWLLYTFEVCDM